MKTSTSPRATYVAAFLLGALVALLLLAPARAADPFFLDRIGVVRFTPIGSERLLRQAGVLDLEGNALWRPATEIARPANTPDYALNRPLITREAWSAYRALAPFALDAFEPQEGAVTIQVGTESFYAIGRNPDAVPADGRVINVSTRAVLPAGDEVVSGFVIEGRARAVLVRAIGPGLTRFGVANAATDTVVSIRRRGQTIYFNDNWSTQPEAHKLEAVTTHVGAFPLERGSRDAARVVLLPPGAYTVHVENATGGAAGAILLEIYSLPNDGFYEPDIPLN
jgi:hypothetical protein